MCFDCDHAKVVGERIVNGVTVQAVLGREGTPCGMPYYYGYLRGGERGKPFADPVEARQAALDALAAKGADHE